MIFLFDTVYLDHVSHFAIEKRSVVISDEYDPNSTFVGISTKTDKIVSGVHKYLFESVNHFFESKDTHSELISFLLDNSVEEKITVYGSWADVATIYAKFIKTIKPSASDDTVKQLTYLALLSEYIYIHQNSKVESLLTELEAVLSNIQAPTTGFDLSPEVKARVRASLSIEFDFADWLLNKNKSKFENKFKKLLIASFVHEFNLEAKNKAIAWLPVLKEVDPVVSFDPKTQTLAGFCQTFPQYAFLLDDKISIDNIEHVISNYNLQQLAVFFKKMVLHFENEKFEPSKLVLDALINFGDVDVNGYINVELLKQPTFFTQGFGSNPKWERRLNLSLFTFFVRNSTNLTTINQLAAE